MPDESADSPATYEAGRLLVSYQEARRALGGISAPTLYKMLGNGDLDRVKIGKRCFITAESMDRYVQVQVAKPGRRACRPGKAS